MFEPTPGVLRTSILEERKMRHLNGSMKSVLETVCRVALVSAVGGLGATSLVGCDVESPTPDDASSREEAFPPSDMVGPGAGAETVTLAQVKSCLASSAAQGNNITNVVNFGAAGQQATSTIAAAGYPAGDCYLVVSGGDAANWSTVGNVNAQPAVACTPDPVYGALCDVGGVDVSIFVPAGSTKITFDYKFMEWDYVPFEDPLQITLYNQAGQPVASTGSQNSCEFSNKQGSDLSIGNLRTVAFSVGAFQNTTVKIRFQASDRNDHILDSGGLINNLQVIGGAMPCGSAVCGGCANAANCAAIDADADGVNACTDCNDNNPNIKPGAAEICNQLDDNCSGVADENSVCCVDNDGDGVTGCNGDCNDNNPNIKPGKPEICDGVDNDCNGLIDFIGTQPVCAPPDDDGDGYNQNDDCNDGDASIYPGAPESCNFTDDDCDGVVDDGVCATACVTITDGVNGGSSEDVPLLGDYPTYAAGNDFGAHTGISSGGNENHSLFRFNLSQITAGLGPNDDINVTSATFSVHVAWNPSYNQVSVHGCNANWGEFSASYNNYPASNCDANPTSSFNAGGVGFRSANVTALATQWLTGAHANYGFMLREAPVNSHYFYTNGPTTELNPKLEICYFVSH